VTQAPDLAIISGLRDERLRAVGGTAHEDVLAGLRSSHRRLPARLAYDATGFQLLGRLWETPTYYPARRERELLAANAGALAELAGPRARVIEPWHGDVERSLLLLRSLDRPAVYVPIDGDPARLRATAERVRAALPELEVQPAVTLDEALPRSGGFMRTVAFLPGTLLGSLEPSHAVRVMTLLAAIVGEDGALVLGADATSDPAPLLAAYEDREGCAERWARHALGQLGVDTDAFAYHAIWHPASNRLDLSMMSKRRTAVVIAGETFELDVGEAITVDQRYQHSTEAMHAMLGIAGWQARRTFTATPEPMRIWLCDRWHRNHRR
jgi:L-histidine N-alpha-methyltransferase